MPLRRIQPWSRTVAMIRLLRAAGPVRQRRRLTRQQQPDLIRAEYFNALVPVGVRPALAEFKDVADDIVRLLAEERREQGKMDSARSAHARALIDKAASKAVQSMRPHEIYDVAKRFGQRTSAFQRDQLDQQIRSAFGVPLAAVERPIRDKLEGFAALNVDLIKTVPQRYFDRLRLDVEEAFESGMHPETLAKRFAERDGTALSDARRIARDQIGKLNGELNQERQRAMGVTGYRWRGTLDNRERDEHREREGRHFDWSDPPEDGHPGEPVQCRCYAEPDLTHILGAVDD